MRGSLDAEKWHGQCIAGVDYDAVRGQALRLRTAKIEEVKGLVSKLQKAQRAAEDALDLCDTIGHDMRKRLFVGHGQVRLTRYHNKCS